MNTSAQDIKQTAHQLIDQLPDNTTWEELVYQLEVRASIERGLADSRGAGHLIPHSEIRKEFGIKE